MCGEAGIRGADGGEFATGKDAVCCYDNAQLARVYLRAWQVTGELFYQAIVEETLDYVARP